MIIKATANLAKPFDCNATGIKRCHGDCCIKIKSYWPLRAYQPSGCPYCSKTGCTLSIQDRPIDCLLYPLYMNGKGTLVVHNHCYHKKWMCHDNVGVGMPLIDSIKDCLIELFDIEYPAMRQAVMRGEEYHFPTTKIFDKCREHENLSIKYDLPIIPRSEIKKDPDHMIQIAKEYIERHKRPVSAHFHEV
jgi:hypothetical protein